MTVFKELENNLSDVLIVKFLDMVQYSIRQLQFTNIRIVLISYKVILYEYLT